MYRSLLASLGLTHLDQEHLSAIALVGWFERCGMPAEFDVPFPAQQVESWTSAMEACENEDRKGLMLEAQNDLTAYLHAHHPRRYQQWNKIAEEAKQRCVLPLEKTVWQPLANSRSLGPSFISSTRWNVLGAIMEHEYRKLGIPIFFSHLLTVYRSGHFPCGWIGTLSSGKLLFY